MMRSNDTTARLQQLAFERDLKCPKSPFLKRNFNNNNGFLGLIEFIEACEIDLSLRRI